MKASDLGQHGGSGFLGGASHLLEQLEPDASVRSNAVSGDRDPADPLEALALTFACDGPIALRTVGSGRQRSQRRCPAAWRSVDHSDAAAGAAHKSRPSLPGLTPSPIRDRGGAAVVCDDAVPHVVFVVADVGGTRGTLATVSMTGLSRSVS